MSGPVLDVEAQKRAVGQAAAALVKPGMTVGLGTGSTAAWMVRALAERAGRERLDLRCVATSRATGALAGGLGLRLVGMDEVGSGAVGRIDLTLDGADEVGPGLALIKGAGAALLREKLVWEASTRCVVIADEGKVVERLGRSLLPVEVVAFGHATTAARLHLALAQAGLFVAPTLRVKDGAPVRTDDDGLIYDIACGAIADPPALAKALKAVTGVIDHGLFLGLAGEALIGTATGVERRTATS